ncbi:VOC family protein [Streptomyces sp. NPDC007901]|uniref:VOC family protein n=1 Tax=Streptomyces sp. NPDC007901 TaxID=3364785 RepID=UPI0036E383E3
MVPHRCSTGTGFSGRRAARTDVPPRPGLGLAERHCVHPDLGTRNHLVALDGTGYLEIIGPDPDRPVPPGARPFGVDGLTTARTVTWAISPPDLDAAVAAARARGHDPGTPHPMSRRRPGAPGLGPILIDRGASLSFTVDTPNGPVTFT